MTNTTAEKKAMLQIINENKPIVESNLKLAKEHIKIKKIKKTSKKSTTSNKDSFFEAFMDVAYEELRNNAKERVKENISFNHIDNVEPKDDKKVENFNRNKNEDSKKISENKTRTYSKKIVKPLEYPPVSDNNISVELINPFIDVKRKDGYAQLSFSVLNDIETVESDDKKISRKRRESVISENLASQMSILTLS